MDADGSRRVALCALLATFLGCGGRASSPSAVVDVDASALADAAVDAMQADAPVDAGTFVCGDTRCPLDTITICVDSCSCLVETELPIDAGVCPDGSVLSEAGSCVVPPVCAPPSCTQLDPLTGAFCSGQGGTLSGGVYPPLPAGSGRTCHVSCL